MYGSVYNGCFCQFDGVCFLVQTGEVSKNIIDVNLDYYSLLLKVYYEMKLIVIGVILQNALTTAQSAPTQKQNVPAVKPDMGSLSPGSV